MRKGQGSKNRETYLEAKYGVQGVVALLLHKRDARKLTVQVAKALDAHPKRNAAQDSFLVEQRKQIAVLNDDIAQIMEDAPKEFPTFLDDLAKANKVKSPVYPEEVRVLEKYAYLRFVKPIMDLTLDQMEGSPLPPPATISYSALLAASQDENGSPDKFQFSRIVKRYGLKLSKEGRDVHLRSQDRGDRKSQRISCAIPLSMRQPLLTRTALNAVHDITNTASACGFRRIG